MNVFNYIHHVIMGLLELRVGERCAFSSEVLGEKDIVKAFFDMARICVERSPEQYR